MTSFAGPFETISQCTIGLPMAASSARGYPIRRPARAEIIGGRSAETDELVGLVTGDPHVGAAPRDARGRRADGPRDDRAARDVDAVQGLPLRVRRPHAVARLRDLAGVPAGAERTLLLLERRIEA